MKLPEARNTDIIVQDLAKEILIYDLITNKAYCLNETSKIVYQSCGNGVTFDELKRKHQFTDDLIYLALYELKKNNLLAEQYVSPFVGMNRREVIRKVGLASMIALPAISTLIGPTAAQAASNQINIAACQPCTEGSQCASGRCASVIGDPSNKICTNGTFGFAFLNGQIIPLKEGPITQENQCDGYGEFCCLGKGATYGAFGICTCTT